MEIKIPELGKEDIDVRVQSTFKASNGKVYATLLLYKNARVDMRILDKVFGVTGWQREHHAIDGKLYCTVSVWDGDKHQWIKKQDVGTENMQQAQKSEASDSFKRACFNVGIGRELYSAPNIFIELKQGEYTENGSKIKCKTTLKFTVGQISYNEDRTIDGLIIVDNKGLVRFALKPEKQHERG